jgi:hypothetical protein
LLITADIDVEELVAAHPKASGYLAERGIVCIRCGEPYWGTLRELAAIKNLENQIDDIVADLIVYLEEAASDE